MKNTGEISSNISSILNSEGRVVTTSVGDFTITPLLLPVKFKVSEHLKEVVIDNEDSCNYVNLNISANHLDSIINALATRVQNSKANDISETAKRLKSCKASDLFKIVESIIEEDRWVSNISEHFALKKSLSSSEGEQKYNPFQFIGSLMKYFRYDYNQLLWDIPFSALTLYSMSIPSFTGDKEKGEMVEKRELTGRDLFEKYNKK